MTASEPAPGPDATDVRAGLEEIRFAERMRISRALHDHIGPSLCSAGLMVGLLRSKPADFAPMANDMLETIQDALETAIDAVRALSSSADPTLARRCGLRGALEFIARAHKAGFDPHGALPGWTGPRADAACRVLHDALLVLPPAAAAPRIECHSGAVSLSAATLLPARPLAALATAAAAAGLRLECRADGSATYLALTAEDLP
jgi:hypothetical protein